MILIKHLKILKELIEAVNGNTFFHKSPKRRYEFPFAIDNVEMSINYEQKYAGNYYTYISQIFWIGYNDSFGFCISFYITNKELIKTALIDEETYLRNYNITYVFEYADINGGEYWITIPLGELNKISIPASNKSDIFEIIEIVRILDIQPIIRLF